MNWVLFAIDKNCKLHADGVRANSLHKIIYKFTYFPEMVSSSKIKGIPEYLL